MDRTTIVSALALALVAGTVSAVGDRGEGPEVPHAYVPEQRIARMDPARAHAAIQAGEAFDVPTVVGAVTAAAGGRIKPTIAYADVGADGEVVMTERPPNVWTLATTDGDARGAVLSFQHTFRAWLRDDAGVTFVEPLVEGPGAPLPVAEYRVYRIPDLLGAPPRGGIGILSHIEVFKDVYAYVDTQFRDEYGSCCWADQVNYILNLANWYFDDVELEYDFYGGTVDSGFNTNDLDTAWNRLISLSYNGANVKSYWSYRDFDGCDVGTASFPGSIFIIQHKEDTCHLGAVPSTDAERAYLTAHELGLNNNADPIYHWSDTTIFGHEHRSIMDESLWGHYHGCWSQTNMNRMSSYLGTSSVGTAC